MSSPKTKKHQKNLQAKIGTLKQAGTHDFFADPAYRRCMVFQASYAADGTSVSSLVRHSFVCA